MPPAPAWIGVVLAIASGLPLAACATSGPRLRLPAPVRALLGRSVRNRRIAAVDLRGSRARLTVLVVGCVHGNEPAGIAIARRLRREPAVPGVDLWILDDLNPDGVAAGTRQNADGVDLNRNFPWHWRHLGRRGDQQYSGERPLSEPEARAADALVLRVKPVIAIWFHQPLALVDESGGSVAVERRFAHLAQLPLRRLPRYAGSAVGWQDHRLRGTTAFVVELPRGQPSATAVIRYAAAVRRLAAEAATRDLPHPLRARRTS